MRSALVAAGILLSFGLAHANPAQQIASSDVEIRVQMPPDDQHPRGGHALCSGVYLGNGIILTAQHCGESTGSTFTVILDNKGVEGASFPATVLSKSSEADLMLLKVDSNLPASIATLACRAPVIGEAVEVVGNPLGITFVHTWGHVAGVTRDMDQDDKDLVPVDAEIASGNSGGPVYDIDGKVLGIADAVMSGADTGGVGEVRLMVSSVAGCALMAKVQQEVAAGNI